MPRGVRLNPAHDERTRAKIQTSQLCNRLHDFVFGKIEMNHSQVQAALGLIRKTMPDLSTQHVEGNVRHSFVDFLRSIRSLDAPRLEGVAYEVQEPAALVRPGDPES